MNFEIVPEKIIGDLDSITEETKKFFLEKNIEIQKIPDQDSTDLEKALLDTQAENIFCFGFTGKFFDHSVSLLHILEKNFCGEYSSSFDNLSRRIFVFSEDQIFFVVPRVGEISFLPTSFTQYKGKYQCNTEVKNSPSIPLNKGEAIRISFYPLTPTTFTQSSGLKYPLDGLTLEQGKIIGISNEAVEEKISWEISEGCCVGFFPIEYAPKILQDLYDISLD
jgi:thiamine pyrophosphokinase